MKVRISLLLMLFSVGGCGFGFGSKAEELVAKSFTMVGKPEVTVETFNGPIEVSMSSNSAVLARVTKIGVGKDKEDAAADLKNIEVVMSMEANRIRIIAKVADGVSSRSNRGAHVNLQVPAGAILDLKTSNGNVVSNGPFGDVQVHTSNGGVAVTESTGKLQLSSSNGAIVAKGGAGLLDLHTSNGRIDVQSDNATVNAKTSNGSIHFAGNPAAGEHSLHTSNGSLDVALPSNAAFHVQADTTNGVVTCDFPVSRSDDGKRNHLTGIVGENPQVQLKLQTSNGSIAIRSVD